VRAGDFFGPLPGNNWFSQGMVKPGRPVRAITYPGDPGVGHAWAYLPDLAEAMARIVNEDARLQAFETFHFRGHWDEDGLRMIEAIRSATGLPQLPVRRLPWMLFRLLSPAVPLFREMAEMRYLWREPFDLDNTRLVRLLGGEPHTPIVDAVRETLRGLGCLLQ
jgi:nucleoside-diphosphate-sugar epimerase